ncbi:UDP-galactose transporter [Peniophora sp. CONT]|nr:UDP-galactose transporter [Peniophora sp. CONT]
MAVVRLIVCVSGVYAMFLLWAVAQERLSVPFASRTGGPPARFNAPQVLSALQALLSMLSALIYLFIRAPRSQPPAITLGLAPPSPPPQMNGSSTRTGSHHGHKTHTPINPSDVPKLAKGLLSKFAQCALSISAAAPFGFAALQHVSYPAMVLAKSCKLVPVLLMNVLLYRRKFAIHKYVVVGLVTAGISMFMFASPDKKHSSKASGGGGGVDDDGRKPWIGMMYLLANLLLDGATNSTQDEVFARAPWKVSGQHMMLYINAFSLLITTGLSALPLPHVPVLHPGPPGVPELMEAFDFVRNYEGVLGPLLAFAACGAIGQLFIFETLEHFGSLTLVTVTLTRKLFTMLLSVVVYGHTLASGQWTGAAIVFAGIALEAWVKRRDVHAKRVLQEKEKAKIKQL